MTTIHERQMQLTKMHVMKTKISYNIKILTLIPKKKHVLRDLVGNDNSTVKVKVKVIPQQAEVAEGVPGKLRPRIFFMFGTTRVVGRQS